MPAPTFGPVHRLGTNAARLLASSESSADTGFRVAAIEMFCVRRGFRPSPVLYHAALPCGIADARSLEDMRRVIRPGYDILVHTPAWHGIHGGRHPASDFWQLNVDGTYNALTAAVEAGINRVVWAGSAVFYGPV